MRKKVLYPRRRWNVFLRVFCTVEAALEWIDSYNCDRGLWQVVEYEGMAIAKSIRATK